MIKFLQLNLGYIFKRKTFIILALTAIIPSLIAGVSLLPFSEVSVIANPSAFKGKNFLEIYWAMTGYGSSWFLKFLVLVIFSMMLTVLIATVDRHMRLGDLRFRNPLIRINESLWVVLPVFLTFVLMKEVFDVIMALVAYFVLPLNGVVMYGVLGVGYLVVYFLFSLLISIFVIWAPHTFNTGLSAPKSLASSVKLVDGHVFSLGLTVFVGLTPFAVLSCVGILAGGVITMLTSSICYFALSLFFVVLMYVAYYEISGIEREDINVVDIWDRKH